MTISTVELATYRDAVDRLVQQFADLGPMPAAEQSATTDDEQTDVEVAAAASLNSAVETYVEASHAVFMGALDDDPKRALATLGGDFRALTELATIDEGPSPVADQSADGPTFSADMADVVAAASGEVTEPPVVVIADSDAVESAKASIDAISALGKKELSAALSAAILPSTGQLGEIVGSIFGPAAGANFQKVLAKVQSWWEKIKKAAVKLLEAAVAKISALFGSGVSQKLQDWIADLLKGGTVYEAAFQVPTVRAKVASGLPNAPDAAARAARIAALAEAHERDQRWIGWGVTALSWAGPKVRTLAPPYGMTAVVTASVALIALCAWLTGDYLDSYQWVPNRIPGVLTALS